MLNKLGTSMADNAVKVFDDATTLVEVFLARSYLNA